MLAVGVGVLKVRVLGVRVLGGWSIGVDTGVQSVEGISDGVGVLRCGRSVRVGWEC